MATVDDGFCRAHAVALELDIDERNPINNLIGALDRVLSSRSREPLAAVLGEVLNGAMNSRQVEQMVPRAQLEELRRRFQAAQQQAQKMPPRQAAQPPPPAPPPRVWIDPLLAAREVLGFEPKEVLTRERVQERKKALARVFHPDMPGGSKAAMQRVLTSADALLAKIT